MLVLAGRAGELQLYRYFHSERGRYSRLRNYHHRWRIAFRADGQRDRNRAVGVILLSLYVVFSVAGD
jgi:hypothetical protein